jgi:tRNA1Val (adenine37-N6)-methyltransferase
VQALVKNDKLYDFIISNPPFYEQDLRSPDSNKNLALHSEALTLKELLVSANKLLAEKGHFAVLLPFERKAIFIALAEKEGLYVQKSTDIQQTEKHAYFRTMLLLSRTETAVHTDSMIIKVNNAYSSEFRALLTPYYLPF